jgi:hypothetical protein
LMMVVGEARAINWEGHEEPALMHEGIAKFTDGVPPPLAKPLPTCVELEEKRRDNIYEQVPIAGKNCVGEDVK